MLHYKIMGSGEPIVILHGLFGSGDNWKTFANQLSLDYRVILVDLRNHGRSFWDDDFDYELAAADIVELLNFLNIDKSHVIGHSMGGKIALHLAQNYSDMILRTVVIDIGFKRYNPSHQEIFKSIFSIQTDQIDSRRQADELLSQNISNIAVRQFLLKNLSRRPEGGYRWKANFKSLYNNYSRLLDRVAVDKIRNETLFIRGLKSGYITNEEKDEITASIKNSEVVEIDAGHWVHAERPMELLQAIKAFLHKMD